jgi:hypothetical protein
MCNLASKNLRSGNLVRPTPTIRVARVVIDVDFDAGMVSLVRSGEADKVRAGVGAGTGDADPGREKKVSQLDMVE